MLPHCAVPVCRRKSEPPSPWSGEADVVGCSPCLQPSCPLHANTLTALTSIQPRPPGRKHVYMFHLWVQGLGITVWYRHVMHRKSPLHFSMPYCAVAWQPHLQTILTPFLANLSKTLLVQRETPKTGVCKKAGLNYNGAHQQHTLDKGRGENRVTV